VSGGTEGISAAAETQISGFLSGDLAWVVWQKTVKGCKEQAVTSCCG